MVRFSRMARGEQPRRHVGPAPRAVDGEVAQAGGGQAVEVRVGVRHQLVGLLAGGVQAHRVVDRVVGGERNLGVGAVDAGRAGVDEVLDAVVAAAFEQVGEADDVRLHVGVRILQRVAHAGLRGEVDDGVEVAFLEQVFHHHAVGDVVLEEAEVGVGLELLQPRELQRRVVVVVEVVDADHFVAALQQDLRDVHADKPGGAGEQDFHCFASKSGVDSSTGTLTIR